MTEKLLGVLSPSKLVSLVGSVPSAFMIQISGLPVRLLSNAMRSPWHGGLLSGGSLS